MSRISIDLAATRDPRTWRIVAHYQCDRCWRSTKEHRLRLQPQKPIPDSGPMLHECSECVSARSSDAKPSRAFSPSQPALLGTSAPSGMRGSSTRAR